jgi:hypothetical protein
MRAVGNDSVVDSSIRNDGPASTGVDAGAVALRTRRPAGSFNIG